MRVGMRDCDCVPVFCVKLGLGLLPLLDQFRPTLQMGGLFPPRHTTCQCTCGSWYPLLVSGCLPGPGPLGSDPWALSDLCLGSDVSQGLWVHGWICSGVDSGRRGLWARRCSSLGFLHCGSRVVPL
ncbi:hypothetical protein ILYODFUR_023738 [Ilyodon furcidens]|uniref:Uncharacterized protein n=1 Tax=Ilyodon furcidens TaxID=33524 RepID=A0ABV0VJ99_9TELE